MLQDVPLKRLARRQEMADAVVYLVSDYAAYINGENLIIDGGRWLGRDYYSDDLA